MTKETEVKKSKRIINTILIIIGSISLGIGAIGIVLPILPTTPFFLLTLACYTKGSIRFERWFKSTKMYVKYLEPFVKTKAMTNASKVKVLILITGLISIPIIMVDALPMRIVLAAIIFLHYYIFIFRIKSVTKAQLNKMQEEAGTEAAARFTAQSEGDSQLSNEERIGAAASKSPFDETTGKRGNENLSGAVSKSSTPDNTEGNGR